MVGKRFLDQLSHSKEACGGAIFLFEGFLDPQEAADATSVLDSEQFPWDLKPKLYGAKMPQHAYYYDRKGPKRSEHEMLGIKRLEEICQKIEKQFDGKVKEVYCNRFEDPSHHIPWHKDTYGRHIFVLGFGANRKVQFRQNKTKEVSEIIAKSGDLYFLPLAINSTHKHQVCSADDTTDGSRLSMAFFFDTPPYAKKYRVTLRQKINGFLESLLA
eukprot:CAMPEP_0198296136 /NCGR_PEP_ID=MMETSP1449-20131203/31099_1 /TAXON_ID=420275 /ORGANISM="Attheya septentrionalis, Strain CCMP2084" /LENGTH=214 /DNA_ID=CAMNT_0043996657 /DNA_START=9 /DNA_END=653 /DNA_ORIENTATION=+